jgi:RNA polymerase sigma factor (TIGR02999 family)
MSDITQLLRSANSGDEDASKELFARMYSDLKRLARGNLHRNGGRAELNTTMLVHESYLRLAARQGLAPADRPAFFAYVGKVMRSVVLDTVRERQAQKRGGGVEPLQLTTGMANEVLDDERLIAIDDALEDLSKLSPALRELVEMRYFAGLTVAEISEITGKSVRSVERDWEKARALLRKLIEEGR